MSYGESYEQTLSHFSSDRQRGQTSYVKAQIKADHYVIER